MTVDGLIADVTREREILAALAEQGEVVERLTSSIAESVYTLEVLPGGEFVPRFRSESFTALTGGEPTDAPNEAWTERIHPDDRPSVAALHGDSWTIEYRLTGADGVERWILDRAATPRDARRPRLHRGHRGRQHRAPPRRGRAWTRRSRG